MLLTIDIGTSAFKSALWNIESAKPCLVSVSAPLSIDVSDGVKHEVDPSKWLRAFEECCKKLKNLNDVDAIIISGNGPSLVPVFGEPSLNNGLCVPAENARLWLDRRAVNYQEQVSELTGGFVDASFFLPKILLIKNEEPNLYKKTGCFLGCPEYLAFALTGEAHSVFPCEGFDRWFWNENVLEKLDIDKKKLPDFIRPGDLFGTINKLTAEHFGFKKDIPVISGGPDFYAAILGSGVTKPRQICDRTGSSEGINLCTSNLINDARLMSYRHPIKPFWNLSGMINTTGKAIEWGCDLLGLKGFDEFLSLAEKSRPGSGGLVFLPYLAGERAPIWKSSARASWNGISLAAGREQFANSILESIGFAVKDVLTVMEEAESAGGVERAASLEPRAKKLHVTGRLAGIGKLNQIKADITGMEVLEPVYKEAELLGLAITGSCFLGKYSSIAEASSDLVRMEKHFEPDLKNFELYETLFHEYKKSSY